MGHVKKLAIQSGEAVLLSAVGLGLCGYAAFRVARGAVKALRQVFIEFVSG